MAIYSIKANMQIKQWLFSLKTLYILFLIGLSTLNTIKASSKMSHIDRALENSRQRQKQQKKSPLTRSKIKAPEKPKEIIDESKLTPRQRRALRRKRIRATRVVKHLSTMDYEELTVHKNKNLQEKKYSVALKYVERMLLFCDPDETADLTLQAADILYELGEYKKAAALYSEFTLLNPGHPRIEYGMYRSIKTKYATTLTPDRDQSNTHDTLAAVNQFLERGSLFNTYIKEVKDIERGCLQKLAESEMKISEFYIKQQQYKPAIIRLQKIKKEYVASAPELHQKLNELEQLLPEAQRQLLYESSVNLEPVATTLIAENKNQQRPAVERF